MKYLYLTLLFSILYINLNAQDKLIYSRVEIPISDHSIDKAIKLGIDTDHGYRTSDNKYVVEISSKEIELLRENNIPFHISIEDLSAYYVKRSKESRIETRGFNNCFPSSPIDTPAHFKLGSMIGFYTYDEFIAQLDSMHKLYPDLITNYKEIGNFKTFNENPILWLKISDNPETEENEPKALYTGLHHAREPMSMTSLIYYMWYILEHYGKDDEITSLVNNSELYFIPMINPDGYIMNQLTDPLGGGMWRKNVTPNSATTFGTDLNRNYSKFWAYDDEGSSPYGDAETYRGTAPFSEIETQSVKSFCETYPFDIALNYHSYGNLVIYPWGYDGSHCPDSTSFDNIANQFVEYNKFTGGTSTESVGYLTNGCSDDWMYGENSGHNSILALTPEIGNEFDGFWPAEDRIIPLCSSVLSINLDALRYLHNYVKADLLGLPALAQSDKSISIKLNQLGKRPENTIITLNEINNKMLFNNPSKNVLLSSNEELVMDYSYLWNNVKSGDSLKIVINISDNLVTRSDTFILEYYDIKEVIFKDDCNSLDNWTGTGEWGLSYKTFISPGASLTDSPDSTYQKSSNSIISSNDEFTIDDKSIKTYISYAAKWATEKFYDYAAAYLYTSEDSIRHYLCTKHTSMGSFFQLENESVYESNSIKWDQEVSDISYLKSKPFTINFLMDADGFDERDGIYIDDIAITTFREMITEENSIIPTTVNIYPNPLQDIVNVSSNQPIANITISDMFARKYLELDGKREEQIKFSLPANICPGIYLVEIKSVDGSVKTVKAVVLKTI